MYCEFNIEMRKPYSQKINNLIPRINNKFIIFDLQTLTNKTKQDISYL